MKLFITNKKEFEEMFTNPIQSREIHIKAFNELKNSLDCHYSIPLVLTPSYDDEGVVLLNFINRKEDVYFYEYTTIAK